MSETFDIQEYMTEGVRRIVKDALKATLKDPRGSAFMVKFAAASARADAKRREAEDNGEHIPPFLIASITSACNLHCAGCYSRTNHATTDEAPVRQLTSAEWFDIFKEADEIGVSSILLDGGEPMLRRDIIQEAGKMQNIMFPIFTNGTFMDERYFELFDKCRNLIPLLSIEGDQNITDTRRGGGIYEKLIRNMDELHKRGLIYGASITVTSENTGEVMADQFLNELSWRGCKAVIYVEFVPVTEESKNLTLSEEQEVQLVNKIETLRQSRNDMVFVAFPGDEKGSGGCIAAGRGFFHINSHGGAEPCPFSPYSDINVRDTSLKEAVNSELFRILRDTDVLKDDHQGGCVLFEKRDQVEAILAAGRMNQN